MISCSNTQKTTPNLLGPGASLISISPLCTQVENYYFPENKAFVSILDQSEVAVTDFAIGNFSIVEDGLPSIVTTVKKINNLEEPLSTALVIDRSGSMEGDTLQSAKDAAISYVNAMTSTDSAEIVLYDDAIEVPQGFTTDKSALIAAINSATARGATATYDATVRGAKDLAKQRGRKVILVMTDGDDNSSSNTEAGCISSINANGLACYTIGVGLYVEMSRLNNIANGTGGRSYTSDGTDLVAVYQKILYQLNNQVQINFRTHIAGQSGGIRNLSIYMHYGQFSTTIKKVYGKQ